MLVVCFIWWASSEVWLLCTSLPVNFSFSFMKGHLVSQRPWVLSSGLWSGNDAESPQESQTGSQRWGGHSPRRWVFKQKGTDWLFMTPATHRKLCWITFKVLSSPTAGFCWSEWRMPGEERVLPFIQQAFAEHLVRSGVYRRLWGYDGERDRCDSCPHGAYNLVEPTDVIQVIINNCKVTAVIRARKTYAVPWSPIRRGFDPLWKVREALLRNCL